MNNCKTCKHWNNRFEDDDTWGNCRLTSNKEGKYHPDTKAYAQDTEGYFAVLRTAEDYGCVQWELKEKESND